MHWGGEEKVRPREVGIVVHADEYPAWFCLLYLDGIGLEWMSI